LALALESLFFSPFSFSSLLSGFIFSSSAAVSDVCSAGASSVLLASPTAFQLFTGASA
jgi:hypothetical protein